jgi:hypothetical protein
MWTTVENYKGRKLTNTFNPATREKSIYVDYSGKLQRAQIDSGE